MYAVPLVDQHRERSIIAVSPNGANEEVFHVEVPLDRILVGTADEQQAVPKDLRWPDDARLAGIRAELFKIRNESGIVVGIASRIAAVDVRVRGIVEWVLHLPARGSLYVSMRPELAAGGQRNGVLRAGTREFNGFSGSVVERWVQEDGGSAPAPAGRIELTTKLVAAPR